MPKPSLNTARCPLSLCLSAETDTNQTADPESNSGSAEPYSDLAKPRKYDTAAGKQACTCPDRKQGDTTRNDADDDRTAPRQPQVFWVWGKAVALLRYQLKLKHKSSV